MAGFDQSVGCGCRRLRLVQASDSNRAVVESIRSGQLNRNIYIYIFPADLRRQDHRERREGRKKKERKNPPSRIPSMSHQMRRERGQMKAVSGEDKSQSAASDRWVGN